MHFHHGSNSPSGKENSVPYWIDQLAGKFFAEVRGVTLMAQKLDDVVEVADARFVERASYDEIADEAGIGSSTVPGTPTR
jgi:hypothetical protein